MYHDGYLDSFKKFLPEGEEVLQRDFSDDLTLDAMCLGPKERFSNVHYSWLYDTVKELSSKECDWYLSSVDYEDVERVYELLHRPLEKVVLSDFGKRFLSSQFLEKWKGVGEVLPISLLPSSPFKIFLFLEKKDSVHLLYFLGNPRAFGKACFSWQCVIQ